MSTTKVPPLTYVFPRRAFSWRDYIIPLAYSCFASYTIQLTLSISNQLLSSSLLGGDRDNLLGPLPLAVVSLPLFLLLLGYVYGRYFSVPVSHSVSVVPNVGAIVNNSEYQELLIPFCEMRKVFVTEGISGSDIGYWMGIERASDVIYLNDGRGAADCRSVYSAYGCVEEHRSEWFITSKNSLKCR